MNVTIEQEIQAEEQPDSKDDVPERQVVTTFDHPLTVANIDGKNRRYTSFRRHTMSSANRLLRPEERAEQVGRCRQF